MRHIYPLSNIEHCGNRVRPMGIIATLAYKESKILAGLHFIKIHKNSTIIDEHGTVLMAIYYLNKMYPCNGVQKRTNSFYQRPHF